MLQAEPKSMPTIQLEQRKTNLTPARSRTETDAYDTATKLRLNSSLCYNAYTYAAAATHTCPILTKA